MKNYYQKTPIMDEMYFQLMHDRILRYILNSIYLLCKLLKLSFFSLALGLACSREHGEAVFTPSLFPD